ncbi:hypothetical protein [Rhodococcus erythropolis]
MNTEKRYWLVFDPLGDDFHYSLREELRADLGSGSTSPISTTLH